MKYFISTFILINILSSCLSNKTEKTIELEVIPSHFTTIIIDDSVRFSFPKDLLKTDNLKFSGDHQFSDLINVQYVVVQEDDKSNTLNLFAADKLEKIQRKMEELSSNKLTSFKLQDIKGVETKFESKVYGWPSKLFFWISVVELKNKFVTTITWTTIDRKDKFQKDAELIIKSFRRK